MGARWSTNLRDTRSPILTSPSTATTAPPPIPSAFNFRPSANHQPRALTPAPAPVPAPPSAVVNRVTAFHSPASWKTFFEASKTSNKLVVIEFTAAWCGPCRNMEPTVNEYAAKFSDVDFVKIDVDELCNVSNEYGIQAMPTFLLMKRGKEVDKVVGAKKEDLHRKIDKLRSY